MANLNGQNIGTNYKGILNLNTLNGNLTTTLEAITDGDGNASPLRLSTNEVGINRTIALSAGSSNVRLINETYTINNSGAQSGTATGIFLNATETALNGMGHNLMDLQRGGVSQFVVSRDGSISASTITSTGTWVQALTFRFGNFGTRMRDTSDGRIALYNNAENNFDRLQLGGTTNAFPAIKRNGAAIDFRLADDSGFCSIQANKMGLGGVSPAAAYDLTLNTSGLTMNPVAAIDWGSGNARINCSTFDIFFSTYTGSSLTEKMRITSNGAMCMGTTTANASAILQADSTSRGFLPPRLTTAQRDLIGTPAAGLMIYNTSTNRPNFYDGSAWVAL